MQKLSDKNNLLERITVNPAIMLGKPTLRGTRLTIEHLLKAMAGGLSYEDLKEDFPFLEPADLHACFHYAATLVESEKVYTVAH
jgi:uncharacterized protein (DUF433 family)